MSNINSNAGGTQPQHISNTRKTGKSYTTLDNQEAQKSSSPAPRGTKQPKPDILTDLDNRLTESIHSDAPIREENILLSSVRAEGVIGIYAQNTKAAIHSLGANLKEAASSLTGARDLTNALCALVLGAGGLLAGNFFSAFPFITGLSWLYTKTRGGPNPNAHQGLTDQMSQTSAQIQALEDATKNQLAVMKDKSSGQKRILEQMKRDIDALAALAEQEDSVLEDYNTLLELFEEVQAQYEAGKAILEDAQANIAEGVKELNAALLGLMQGTKALAEGGRSGEDNISLIKSLVDEMEAASQLAFVKINAGNSQMSEGLEYLDNSHTLANRANILFAETRTKHAVIQEERKRRLGVEKMLEKEIKKAKDQQTELNTAKNRLLELQSSYNLGKEKRSELEREKQAIEHQIGNLREAMAQAENNQEELEEHIALLEEENAKRSALLVKLDEELNAVKELGKAMEAKIQSLETTHVSFIRITLGMLAAALITGLLFGPTGPISILLASVFILITHIGPTIVSQKLSATLRDIRTFFSYLVSGVLQSIKFIKFATSFAHFG